MCTHFLSKVLEDAFHRDMGVHPGRSKYHIQEQTQQMERIPRRRSRQNQQKGLYPQSSTELLGGPNVINHKSLHTNGIKPATKAEAQEKQGTSKDAEKYRKQVR